MLFLPTPLAHLIRAEGEKTYPFECCGLILGKLEGFNGNRKCHKIIPLNNTREGEDKLRRFVIEPLDFLRAEKTALAAGLEVLGIYHSHPDHPAYPSQYDLENALPFYSYIICSVISGKATELNSYLLSEDRLSFTTEPISFIA
ncbi:MAG: M67 family metallopeptidase [Deltaproteobacteria bacterium]|jgi:proteasome lid subunit RPN8/RPN11|nr:M67 family metallopeptidase [Deltaproteobacteria bacterium]